MFLNIYRYNFTARVAVRENRVTGINAALHACRNNLIGLKRLVMYIYMSSLFQFTILNILQVHDV